MVMIPKTVKELKDYLDTYDDDVPIFVEDAEGLLWWFSINRECEDPEQFKGALPYLMISPFTVLNDWSEVS